MLSLGTFLIETGLIFGFFILLAKLLGNYPRLRSYFPLVVFWILMVYLNIQTFLITSPRSFGDTLDYLGRGLLVMDGNLVCCQRPFVVPLIYKTLLYKTTLITIFQLFFSIFSWSILAYVFSQTFEKNIMKTISFVFIMFFSLSTSINQWQRALLSESITFSSFALLIAFWILYLRKSGFINLSVLGLITILWSFSRYTNFYTMLLITTVWGVYLIWQKKKIPVSHIVLLLVYVFITIWGLLDSRGSKGWIASLGNVVIQRVLFVDEAREYFADAGMPIYPATVIFEKNHLVWTDDWVFFRNPQLQEFRDWLTDRGMTTFFSYLISHPKNLLLEPWDNREDLLGGWPPSNTYAPKGFITPLGNWMNLTDFPYSPNGLFVFLFSIIMFAGVVLIKNPFFDNRLWLPIFMIVLSIPLLILVFHSDPNDIERHALHSGVQLRLGMWMILLYAFDLKQYVSTKRNP